jgi:hypothetical protein
MSFNPPSQQFFPYLTPVGVYPPSTVRWFYSSVTVPAGVSVWTVPWQPGTPPGVLIPIQWLVTDIFFRVENAASSGNTTLVVSRSTSTGVYLPVNNINDAPIVIPAGQYEAPGRPWTTATIDNPLVNSGDKLSPTIAFGFGASVVSFALVLVQSPVV